MKTGATFVLVLALACGVHAGCGCPGPFARARGLPAPLAAATADGRRLSLWLDRTQLPWPPSMGGGACTADRRVALLRASVADAASTTATRAGKSIVELVVRDGNGGIVSRQRPAPGLAALEARDDAGHPLGPGRYSVEARLDGADAGPRTWFEVVPCVYY